MGTWICSTATMMKCNCPWLNSSNKVKERKKGKGGATTLAWREGEWSDIKHSVLTDCRPQPNSDHNDHDYNKSHYSNVDPRAAVFSSVPTIQSICPHIHPCEERSRVQHVKVLLEDDSLSNFLSFDHCDHCDHCFRMHSLQEYSDEYSKEYYSADIPDFLYSTDSPNEPITISSYPPQLDPPHQNFGPNRQKLSAIMDDLKPTKNSKAAKSRTIDFHASGMS